MKQITLRFKPEDYQNLRKLADLEHLKVADLARKYVLDRMDIDDRIL